MKFSDYDDLYEKLIDSFNGPEDEEAFISQSQYAQTLYIVAIFNMEIMNGGLCQFFVNQGLPYANRITSALNAMGFSDIASLYKDFCIKHAIDDVAIQSMGITCDSEDRFIQEFISLTERYPFDEFDDSYVELWEEGDCENVMISYANEHHDIFGQ